MIGIIVFLGTIGITIGTLIGLIKWGKSQTKKIKSLVKENQLIPNIEEKVSMGFKRKEKREYTEFKPIYKNRDYFIRFRKYREKWEIVIETAEYFNLIVITMKDGKIQNIEVGNDMKEMFNKVRQHIKLLECSLKQIIELLDEGEIKKYDTTEYENLLALKETILDIQGQSYEKNKIHTEQIGRFEIKFSINDEKTTLFINKGDKTLYEAYQYHRNQKENKQYTRSELEPEKMDYFEKALIPVIKTALQNIHKNEMKNNKKLEWEKEIEQLIQENKNLELKKEYETVTKSYYAMNKAYQEENKELYKEALKKIHSKMEEKVFVQTD